ncbi:Aspyridones efflux protein apdF [Lasiodiplodia hormozganensis]|uniref:Aspyridones efflux protein apdF n=1 Tax=Lasiodiplodia hormozganensis TaxID=869390 RepID=A0AA39Z4Y4_9PEZI|nr:Aspyridones efflux protein apdF [Lasiodiplodia hormozganensis]
MSDSEDSGYSPLTSRWADETTPLLNTAQIPDHDEHVVTQQLHAEPDDFPEGGFRAWSVVFGSWCAMVAAFGMLNSMGVIHAWLSSHQLSNHSYAEIGWIFSTFTFLVYFGSVQIGPVFDTYGLKYTLIPGCVGLVISVFLFSICKEYWQYMLDWGILGGISCCLIFTPAIVSIGHWFMQRRALATSLALTAGGIGGILFPIIILRLEGKIGFNRSLQVIGIVCALLCATAVATIRTRLPFNTKSGASIDVLALVRDPVYAATTAAIFFLELALFIPVTYVTSYALDAGFAADRAYGFLIALNAASIVGRGLSGWLADAWGRFRVMLLTAAACTVITLLWLAAGRSAAFLTAFAAAFGFASGSIVGVTPVCVAQICRTEDYGKRYGTTYFIVSFGTLIGIPLAGAILETGGAAPNYPGLIVFCAAVFGAGFAFFVAAYGMAVGWDFRVKF